MHSFVALAKSPAWVIQTGVASSAIVQFNLVTLNLEMSMVMVKFSAAEETANTLPTCSGVNKSGEIRPVNTVFVMALSSSRTALPA